MRVGASSLVNVLLLTVLFVALLSVGLVQAVNTTQDDSSEGAFLMEGDQLKDLTVSPDALRHKAVNITTDLLGLSDLGDTPAQSIQLTLFDDTTILVMQDEVQRTSSGSAIWVGSVQDSPSDTVQFVVRDGTVIGNIRYKYIDYAIRMSPEGQQYLMQVNPHHLKFSGNNLTDAIPVIDTTPPEVLAFAADDVAQDANSHQDIDNGSILDVIVAYTPEAREEAGSAAAIEASIELAMLQTNAAYENSGANQRIALVHMFETADKEDGKALGVLLDEFSGENDSRFEEIHSLRNVHHADFSHLVISKASGTVVGRAYLPMTPNASNFESSAFGVTAQPYLTRDYVFAHELGHNMGLLHDWYVDSAGDDEKTYPYAHGFTNYQAGWVTIMAYGSRCSAAGTSCVWIPYLSNPEKTYKGDAMGVSGVTPANCVAGSASPEPETCVANNVSVLNSQAATNAQFRISQITWTGANGTDWNDAGNWSIIQGAANRSAGASSTTANRVPLNIDDVVIPGGLTHYPSISGGTAHARTVIVQNDATLTMTGGTLTVKGTQWKEEGTGRFTATGGTVVFDGVLDQVITSGSSSSFNNIQMGNGSTQTITLNSDIDINGNLIISAGATLNAGSSTLNLAGSWTERSPSGFRPGSSTVVFDGVSKIQFIEKTTHGTLFNETFSKVDDVFCCNQGSFPAGWTYEHSSGSGWLVVTVIRVSVTAKLFAGMIHLMRGCLPMQKGYQLARFIN